MMRIVVTGTKGQVARALMERASRYPEFSVIAVGRPDFDFENTATIFPVIADARPDLVINAVAYTAVDMAETEPQRAFAINCDGAVEIASVAQTFGIPLIHLSTDYIFSGNSETAYVETDETGPLGVYGKSKLAGELAVRVSNPSALIFRTSWVYSPFGSNFVKTMLRLAKDRSQLRVVDDQVGSPTSALDLADAILRIVPEVKAKSGAGTTLHLAGTGFVSWCGLARHVFEISKSLGGPSAKVIAIPTADYPTPAPRPVNSRLDTSAFTSQYGFALPEWREGVQETVRRILEDI